MTRTLRARVEHTADPIKGSRFIAVASPVRTEAQARELLAETRSRWADASHHCWAWRLANPVIDRAGDDGEPSGSAGRPILAALVGRELVDTAVVVVRWFGGTKLGVGGLVRAYGGTAAQALDLADTDKWVQQSTIVFEHSPSQTSAVERAVASASAVEVDTTWGASIERTIQLPTAAVGDLWVALADATNGDIARPAE